MGLKCTERKNESCVSCCVLILVIIGLVLSLLGSTWCQFVSFTITPFDRTLDFGVWTYTDYGYVLVSGEGVYRVYGCTGYPGGVDKDGYWKAAQAFAIIAPVFGIIASLLTCCGISGMTDKCVGVVFMFVALCQGLVLLFLSSDVCDASKNGIIQEFDERFPEYEGEIGTTSNKCTKESGVWTVVAAIVCWALAGIVVCAVPRRNDFEDDEEDFAGKVEENDGDEAFGEDGGEAVGASGIGGE